MISAFDQDQLFRFGDRVDQFLQLGARAELIACSADEELRQRAIPKEIVGVNPWFFFVCSDGRDGRDGRSHTDQRLDTWVRTCGAQSNCRAKGESSKDERQVKFRIEPLERCADIVDFSIAVIMFTV